MHRPRRVVLGHVERGEIVPIVLDLGPGRDREAEVGEDLGQLVHHLADRMDAALGRAGARKREVERLGGELAVELRRLERRLARRDRLGDRLAQGVDPRRFGGRVSASSSRAT